MSTLTRNHDIEQWDAEDLYVGGNGGLTPTHAVLLAGDLDDETLIRYIDPAT